MGCFLQDCIGFWQYCGSIDTDYLGMADEIEAIVELDCIGNGIGRESVTFSSRFRRSPGVSSTEAESQPDQIPRCPCAESSQPRLSHPQQSVAKV